MQASLKRLTESVKSLSAAYVQPVAGDACPNFLSQTSLSSYQAAEHKYLDEVNCYVKKQFSEVSIFFYLLFRERKFISVKK